MRISAYKNILTPLVIAILLMVHTIQLPAQPPPPSDPSGGGNEQPVGEDAPIGGGLLILVALGAAYGVRKYCSSEKKS